jgi:hypothetical protein
MTVMPIVVRDYTLRYLLQRAHQPVSLGGNIVASRSDGHCAAWTVFKSELNTCLGCALKYEIWQYYCDSMSKAGTACGLEANPVEVASAVAGTTSATR